MDGQEVSGCLQLVRSRPVTFCDAQRTLRKPSSCIIATALPYFLNTCSYFLLQRTTGFQLNFFWFPLVSVLGSWRFRGLSLLRNLSYLSFRSEEHTSAPVTNAHLVCRLLFEQKN